MSDSTNQKSAFFTRYRDVLICLCLVAATLIVYWQVSGFEFVRYDDGEYVTNNRYVQSGVARESIRYAFTSTVLGYWQPVTLLSHMVDCQLFGLDAGWHHLTNVFFHVANTLLLFFVLRKTTRASWRSGLVAALFALHPLHVESVAWVAERKDVLSTFFWMLTMWSYVRYVERPSVGKYVPIVVFMLLGLLSKPMLVTLPFVLLLFDYWPLGRVRLGEGKDSWRGLLDLRLVWEKMPLFGLAAASCIITYLFQRRMGNIYSGFYTLDVRIANAVASYIGYMWNMIWPFGLTFFYPHPDHIPWWKTAWQALMLASILFFAIAGARRRPYFAVGYLWYLGTLVPVIGLVQVSIQAMNDRFTYVPLIGIFIVIAWGVPEIMGRWRHSMIGLPVAAAALLAFLTATAWSQVRYWRNSIALFEHALDVTTDNYIAHESLGEFLISSGKFEEGIYHCREAIRIKPNYVDPYGSLGNALFALGRLDEAAAQYYELLHLNPSPGREQKARINLGAVLLKKGKIDDAVIQLREVLRINPDNVIAHYNLGVALMMQSKYDDAIRHYSEALKLNPNHAGAHFNMGHILAISGKVEEASAHFREALRIEPDNPTSQNAYAAVLSDLANTYVARGEYDKAVSTYTRLIELHPNDYTAYYNIARICSIQNRKEEALVWLKEAVETGFKNWDFLKNDKYMENIRESSYYQELIRLAE